MRIPYSKTLYKTDDWNGIVGHLVTEGLTENQQDEILNSKYLRNLEPKSYRSFVKYFKENKNEILKNLDNATMTKTEIQDKIADLKKRAQNKSLPASAVTKLNSMITGLEKDLADYKEPESKKEEPKAKKAKVKKDAAPVKKADPAAKKSPDYDCDELIKKEKARKASSKKSAAKSPAAKSATSINKVVDAIEKKVEDGDLTKAQIKALIADLTKRIKELEALLKKAK